MALPSPASTNFTSQSAYGQMDTPSMQWLEVLCAGASGQSYALDRKMCFYRYCTFNAMSYNAEAVFNAGESQQKITLELKAAGI